VSGKAAAGRQNLLLKILIDLAISSVIFLGYAPVHGQISASMPHPPTGVAIANPPPTPEYIDGGTFSIALRNDMAHDLELWEPLSKKTKEAVKHWCAVVINFMKATDYRKSTVRPNMGAQSKPVYLNY